MDYYVAFYRGHGTMADKVVRYATRSPFSHCELILSDKRPRIGDTVRCISASARDNGVRIKDITLKHGKWKIYAVPWAPPETWDRAEALVGKPYELWAMILSQLVNFRRHARNQWYCSEMIAHSLGLSMPHAKSPGDLLRSIHDHCQTWARARNSVAQLRPVAGDDDDLVVDCADDEEMNPTFG
ncbi:hypothetical protein [Jannaschia pohangensis]|uniref:Permuted papain-like amidase enzyme, YaeF/YiiX, C92 family n=1 Tax=Jannaschia pohangensis TaxID=390807 RepID=A0A1I3Q8A3_9RHOB|nr:hypothetical protein [Jannaschia pohangensis]SFJ29627.1 hypothetical protein SAMN04488095_2438 [Jannaschia pohangensis]